jgi:AcrR family transcriptional regulator
VTDTDSTTTRRRVIDAALELTAAQGWSAVTMSAVADQVGVSRQTVYNEVGSKPALAEAMVLAELERFLDVVGRAFDTHPRDLRAAVGTAVRGVLRLAGENALLREIVSSSNGSASELLPPLSTDASALIASARAVLVARLSAYDVAADAARLEAVADLLVRTVLSHVMSPGADPERTAADLAWFTTTALTVG